MSASALLSCLIWTCASTAWGAPPSAEGPVRQDRWICEQGEGPDEAVSSVLVPGNVIVVGELHGTWESPRFVDYLLCRALELGVQPQLMVELPERFQPDLDGLDPRAPADCREDHVWRYSEDGRTSEAVYDLVVTAKVAGVSVQAIDPTGEERDSGMARNIIRLRRPEHLVVVLVGNVHATRVLPKRFVHVSLGKRLSDALGPQLFNLDMRAGGGAAWTMERGVTGIRFFSGNARQPGKWVVWNEPDRASRFDGTWSWGAMSPSSPVCPAP